MSATTRTDVATAASPASAVLRPLYLARAAFAIVWAVAFAATASSIDAFVVVLLLLYPAVDAAATLVDRRRTGSSGPLLLNAALSAVVAVGLAAAAASGEPAVLRVWGAWAVTAGLAQLVVALGRRRLGGQVSLVLSGGISVLAGAGFVLSAAGDDPSLRGLAGYAALGGIFFLVSALRLRRTTS